MMKSFLCTTSFFLLWAVSLAARAGDAFVLVIDAGHGGHDSGAVGSCSKEKNINLNVALAFGKLVEQNCKDVKVIYTRKRDVFVTLDGRAEIANKAKADLFISIHTNALPEGRLAYGSETYTLGMHRAASNLAVAKRENSVITYESNYRTQYEGFDPNKAESYVIFEFMQDKFMKQSVDLARCIQQQYVRANRRDKGVHQAGFLVLRKTSMPAVLTELGFITTPEEERFLNSQEGIQTLAGCIYNGFLEYRRQHGAKNIPQPLVVQKAREEVQPVSPVPAEAKAPNPADDTEAVVEPVSYTMTPAKPAPETRGGQPNVPSAKPSPSGTAAPSAAKTPVKPRTVPAKKAADSSKPSAKSEAMEPAGAAKETVFRIQFAASSAAIDPKDKRFKDLPGIISEKNGNLYRHLAGCYKSRAEANAALKEIGKKYEGAFIVKYIDGKRQ